MAVYCVVVPVIIIPIRLSICGVGDSVLNLRNTWVNIIKAETPDFYAAIGVRRYGVAGESFPGCIPVIGCIFDFNLFAGD
ncbi:hypothetical protein D3C75_1066290 [compost metagenome]